MYQTHCIVDVKLQDVICRSNPNRSCHTGTTRYSALCTMCYVQPFTFELHTNLWRLRSRLDLHGELHCVDEAVAEIHGRLTGAAGIDCDWLGGNLDLSYRRACPESAGCDSRRLELRNGLRCIQSESSPAALQNCPPAQGILSWQEPGCLSPASSDCMCTASTVRPARTKGPGRCSPPGCGSFTQLKFAVGFVFVRGMRACEGGTLPSCRCGASWGGRLNQQDTLNPKPHGCLISVGR